jgi:xanthine dehydrogenase accessory factor
MNSYLDKAWDLTQTGHPFVLATVVRIEKPTSARPGSKAIITADGSFTGWVGGSCAQPVVKRESLKALQDGQPRLLRICPPEARGRGPHDGVIEINLTCASGGTLEIYLEPHLPRPNLVVVGHLPVAEALVILGKDLGYRVSAICLEEAPEGFQQADQLLDHLDFAELKLTPDSYIVVASHGNYDEDALAAALRTDAAYVTLVASKKRSASVLEFLKDSGLSADQLARLKYPAGLDLGAVTPEEIALTILAEILQIRRSGPIPAVAAATPSPADSALVEAEDPVCHMMVEIATARYTASYQDEMFYFCSAGCKKSFEQEPDKYLVKE